MVLFQSPPPHFDFSTGTNLGGKNRGDPPPFTIAQTFSARSEVGVGEGVATGD